MPLPRLLAAAFGLLIPVAMAGAAQAAPHRHHPSAHVRTATYKVAPHTRSSHRLHTTNSHRRHLAQAHRRHSTRRG